MSKAAGMLRGAVLGSVAASWTRNHRTGPQVPSIFSDETRRPAVRPDNAKRRRPGAGGARELQRCAEGSGSPSRTRTCDKAINSRLLYQLSYRGSRREHYPRRGGRARDLSVPDAIFASRLISPPRARFCRPNPVAEPGRALLMTPSSRVVRPTPGRRRSRCSSEARPARSPAAAGPDGLVAEWLRRGLQILAPRFDSGRGLHPSPSDCDADRPGSRLRDRAFSYPCLLAGDPPQPRRPAA